MTGSHTLCRQVCTHTACAQFLHTFVCTHIVCIDVASRKCNYLPLSEIPNDEAVCSVKKNSNFQINIILKRSFDG